MKNRITDLVNTPNKGNVLYICMRDQRIYYNQALNYAYCLSYMYKSQLHIGIPFDKLKMNEVQRRFFLENIDIMMADAKKYNLQMCLLEDLNLFIDFYKIQNIILDYSPLREYTEYYEFVGDLCKKLNIYLGQVDSHNIVPYNVLDVYKRTSSSVKIQLYKHFFEYLEEEYCSNLVNVFKKLEKHKYNKIVDLKQEGNGVAKMPAYEKYRIFKSGYKEGMKVYKKFLTERFHKYAEYRNNPDVDVLSNLSPYLHSGQISSFELVEIAYNEFYKTDKKNLDIFLNEIFIWKETADHYCYHEENYDNINGALEWARNSLQEHAKDKREHIYSLDVLEVGQTQDELWNAAQKELVYSNKMHGYCRMYWAKQLVKWTETPEEAIKVCIYLNDKYSIDGNDPISYLGIMWSICGVMDRAYKGRAITGKIRSMNPFKAVKYIKLWNDDIERSEHIRKLEKE